MVTSGGSEANLGDILKEVPEIKPYYSLGILQLDVSSVEKTKESIDILNNAIDSLEENIDFETLSGSDFYNNLNAVYKDLTNNVKEYDSAVSNLNDNLAQQFIIKGLQGNELPKSKEEFDTFADSVVNASIASEQFIGSEKDIKNSVMAVLQTMPEFSNFFITEQKNVGDTTKSFSDLKEETKSLQETLDSTFSNQSTLQSAFDKIQEGSSLSADDVRKLIELCKDSYPEIVTAFTKTADGYTISANDIISANEAITKSIKEELQNQINEYQKIIYEYNDKKSYVPVDIPYSEYKEYISNLATESDKAQSFINGLRLVMEMFGLTTNETVDKIKDLDDKYKELSDTTSKLTSKGKTLSSAFAEQNENGKLSTDTVLSLIENGYAAALMYDTETGAIRLNAQAYTELAKAIAYYDDLYIHNYVTDHNNILNSSGNGNEISLVVIRESGEFIQPRIMQHTSHIIHTKLDFPEFDFHSLRHTHCTMLLENGANPKYVQKRLGHKNIQVTMQIYQHLTEKMTKDGDNILNNLY